MRAACIILLIATANCYSFAQYTHETLAITRTKKFKTKKSIVTLKNLTSKTHFEGKYFKIVLGTNDEAISLSTTNNDLKLKASTTYYHLTKAHDYFLNKIEGLKDMEQITIRLEITRQFHGKYHYKNENLKSFNNAKSVPEGSGFEKRGISPWGKEIWFRPPQVIKLKDILSEADGKQVSNSALIKSFRFQTQIINWQRFLVQTINRSDRFKDFDYLNSEQFVDSFIRTAGTTLFIELFLNNLDRINRFFSRKRYWMDTALVPEIIYHEFAHIALSDHLQLDLSKPVIEGMADYFAARISNNSKIAAKIKKYSTFKPKNGKNKSQYEFIYETNDYANSDFVLSILWQIQDQLGAKKADQLILKARERLDGQSDIKNDFLAALSDVIREIGSKSDLLTIKRILFWKGL